MTTNLNLQCVTIWFNVVLVWFAVVLVWLAVVLEWFQWLMVIKACRDV